MNFTKSLALTTALSGVALLAANAAVAAEKPTLKISGYQETYFGFADVDNGTTSSGTPTYDGGVVDGAATILQYGEIRFRATGTTDSGMKWGVYFEDVQNERDNTDANKLSTDEAHLELSGSWGKVEIGGQDGAADKMQIDASAVSLYDVRIASAFADTRSSGSTFRGAEDQISIVDTSDDSKITYYTPRISGFQAGLSYVPSVGVRGSVPSGDKTDGLEAGLTYRGKTGDISYEAAGVYAITGEDSTGDEIDGWGLGAKVGFGAFTVTGGYSESNNHRQAGSERQGFTVGANYSGGKWEVSLIYNDTEADLADGTKDEYQEIHFQGAYNLGGGLTASAGVILFDIEDASDTTQDHDGTVFVTKLNARF